MTCNSAVAGKAHIYTTVELLSRIPTVPFKFRSPGATPESLAKGYTRRAYIPVV